MGCDQGLIQLGKCVGLKSWVRLEGIACPVGLWVYGEVSAGPDGGVGRGWDGMYWTGDGGSLENGGISPEELQLRPLFSERIRFLGISGLAGDLGLTWVVLVHRALHFRLVGKESGPHSYHANPILVDTSTTPTCLRAQPAARRAEVVTQRLFLRKRLPSMGLGKELHTCGW